MQIIPINEIVEKYGRMISGLSCRMIRNPEIAKEATQEVWIEISKSLPSFKGNSTLQTWLYTVAKRAILKYALNERVYKANELNWFFSLPEIPYEGDEENKVSETKELCDKCLTGFCHCLGNEARLIFLFRHLVDLSYSEIGKIMDTKEENVRKINSRSRVKVRNFMNDKCLLFNATGDCKCRIKKQVTDINLHHEYQKLGKTAKLAKLFQKYEKELPRQNYWEKFLK